jgi:hypothetical protein
MTLRSEAKYRGRSAIVAADKFAAQYYGRVTQYSADDGGVSWAKVRVPHDTYGMRTPATGIYIFVGGKRVRQ